MILGLVDRRRAEDGTADAWRGARWSTLLRLADGLGGADWPVDVVLVDDEAMVGLNREFRGGADVTDVLSFSYLEEAGAGDPALAAGSGGAARDLWLPSLPGGGAVGELVLAPRFIATRCAAHGWPLEQEIPLLVVHGCLHLLGWDHVEAAEGRAMQDLEQDLLAAEGLPHPLRRRS